MRRPETKSKPASVSAPAEETTRPRIPVWLLAGSLVLVTIALYWPAMRCGFVNYDDPEYVTANPHVQGGLTWESVKWAFLNPVSANWHPLTMMSHMLDCQLYGLHPRGHHLSSVLLHALNAALVFVLLRHLTRAVWRSLWVAALFAVHPLHVESVAWISERKDVLSSFFGLLSLIFYVRYAQRRSRGEGRGASAVTAGPALDSRLWSLDYAFALFFLALGLMSKPMLVTWPFVMLLLDYWPLGRLRTTDYGPQTSPSLSSLTTRLPCRSFGAKAGHASLIFEKLPFFALAAIASIITFEVQKCGGALGMVEHLPLGARVGNALVSYCRYSGKLFWPTNLAVFYPHPGYWPLAEVLLAGLFLVLISVIFYVKRRLYPFLLVGWLWFGGTLVPVIGLVQVGGQAMADRYAYLPSLGIMILTVWGACELAWGWRRGVIVLPAVGLAATVACLVLTRQQLGYWQDSETLFRHALAVTQNNYLARNNLGEALDEKGQTDEAIRQYQEAIRLNPDYANAHNNLGVARYKQGQLEEAISQYQEAIRFKPDYANAHNNLGVALEKQGRLDEAIGQFEEAIRLNPDHVKALNNMGLALATKGQFDEAINNFRQAIQLSPDDDEALNNLGTALAAEGRSDEAIENFRKAVQLNADSGEALNNLGTALAAKGQLDEAIQNYQKAIQINSNRFETFVHLGMALGQSGRSREAADSYRHALKLNPNLPGALNNLAWILATSSDDQLRNGAEAVPLAEHACELTHHNQPLFLGTLAAAYAEAGHFPEAVATAEKAEQLATNSGQAAVATKNRQLLEFYRAGKPYREPAPTGQK